MLDREIVTTYFHLPFDRQNQFCVSAVLLRVLYPLVVVTRRPLDVAPVPLVPLAWVTQASPRRSLPSPSHQKCVWNTCGQNIGQIHSRFFQVVLFCLVDGFLIGLVFNVIVYSKKSIVFFCHSKF